MNAHSSRVDMAAVARLAGVSQPTVSRVVNNRAGVKEETRRRVLAALNELGYRRNPAASHFAASRFTGNKTGDLQLMLLTSYTEERVPVDHRLLKLAAVSRGYGLQMASLHGFANEDALIRRLRFLGIAGLAFHLQDVPPFPLEKTIDEWPGVMVQDQPFTLPIPSVEPNVFEQILANLDAVLASGIKRLALLMPHVGNPDAFEATRFEAAFLVAKKRFVRAELEWFEYRQENYAPALQSIADWRPDAALCWSAQAHWPYRQYAQAAGNSCFPLYQMDRRLHLHDVYEQTIWRLDQMIRARVAGAEAGPLIELISPRRPAEPAKVQ